MHAVIEIRPYFITFAFVFLFDNGYPIQSEGRVKIVIFFYRFDESFNNRFQFFILSRINI